MLRGNAFGVSRRSSWWASALAALSVLAGHGITYALVNPDAHERANFLASTGHAYLHLIEAPAVVLAAAAVLRAAMVGVGGLGSAPDPETVFRRLGISQVAAFVGMEVAERVTSGTPMLTSRNMLVLAVGISTQVVLAAIGAWILDASSRGAGLLTTVLRFPSRVPPRCSFVRRAPRVPAIGHSAPPAWISCRAPPVLPR